jgi:hypothetical protein
MTRLPHSRDEFRPPRSAPQGGVSAPLTLYRRLKQKEEQGRGIASHARGAFAYLWELKAATDIFGASVLAALFTKPPSGAG